MEFNGIHSFKYLIGMPAYISIPRSIPANIGNLRYGNFKDFCGEMSPRNVLFFK